MPNQRGIEEKAMLMEIVQDPERLRGYSKILQKGTNPNIVSIIILCADRIEELYSERKEANRYTEQLQNSFNKLSSQDLHQKSLKESKDQKSQGPETDEELNIIGAGLLREEMEIGTLERLLDRVLSSLDRQDQMVEKQIAFINTQDKEIAGLRQLLSGKNLDSRHIPREET